MLLSFFVSTEKYGFGGLQRYSTHPFNCVSQQGRRALLICQRKRNAE